MLEHVACVFFQSRHTYILVYIHSISVHGRANMRTPKDNEKVVCYVC